ncbi:MAG TPA: hypothetical protein VJ553_05410 [Candidatus Paceibacterota bacterium]|nr:hypothetical protein [Candidatus Paceibacterota bacterium]
MITGQGSSVICMDAVADALTNEVYVKHLRWVGATTAGHQLIVSDVDGNVMWESVADGQYMIDVHPFYRSIKGITVTTMGSGKLYVYCASWNY